MDWQTTALIPENAPPDSVAMNAIAAALPSTERILVACRTGRFEVAGWIARLSTIAITDRAIYIAKDRLLGRPRIDRSIPLEDIVGSEFGPLLGVGPTWEVAFKGPHRSVGTMYFDGPIEAEAVETELRHAASAIQAATNDPDLAAFHRGIAAAQAQPPGELGKTLAAEQIVEESRRMREQTRNGDLQGAWGRRVELGYGVPSDNVPQADRFWLNASPALAALHLGFKDHPMVAMCCGVAEGDCDRSDPEQRQAVEEFNQLFFQDR